MEDGRTYQSSGEEMYTCPTAYTACAVCKHQPVTELHGTAIPPLLSPLPERGKPPGVARRVPTPMPASKGEAAGRKLPRKEYLSFNCGGNARKRNFHRENGENGTAHRNQPGEATPRGKGQPPELVLAASEAPQERTTQPAPRKARLPHPWRGRALRSTASLP